MRRRYEIVSSSIGKIVAVAPNSGLMLLIVARSASDRPASPSPGELDERADDAVAAQHLGHDQHEVGGGGALRQLAGEADADDMGHRLVERLAEQDRLGLDAADAVAEHAEGVDHRRVRVGADERVREGHARPGRRRPGARNSRLTWWTMPVPGGTMRRLRNAVCAQRSSW